MPSGHAAHNPLHAVWARARVRLQVPGERSSSSNPMTMQPGDPGGSSSTESGGNVVMSEHGSSSSHDSQLDESPEHAARAAATAAGAPAPLFAFLEDAPRMQLSPGQGPGGAASPAQHPSRSPSADNISQLSLEDSSGDRSTSPGGSRHGSRQDEGVGLMAGAAPQQTYKVAL